MLVFDKLLILIDNFYVINKKGWYEMGRTVSRQEFWIVTISGYVSDSIRLWGGRKSTKVEMTKLSIPSFRLR